ncbi:glycosyl transferase [Mycobacterium colombiense]|uniref:4,4'-diaponeurosporenoate glycosyltransferase n=1 Tax=Mycobacterium colombiense TaxID=339268 RepID=A0A1A0VAL0_9MYCO|nr:glycosyltransferase [Mycobacterium colombiense]OBB80231.1 glycosyl transferase [Mycobacterium colombiense]
MSTAVPCAYDAAAVVIPAHNERAKLPACLSAVLTAALCAPIAVTIVVVLDGCDDGSEELAGEYGPDVHFISVDVHNVGTARAVGFGYARSLLRDGARSWFATTDADSRVDPGWLLEQLRSSADMVVGVTRCYEAGARARQSRQEVIDGEMGFSASAYWHVGGFRTLATGEKADLVERFQAAGYHIHPDTDLSVITSKRIQARAPYGFADYLTQLGRTAAGDCA